MSVYECPDCVELFTAERIGGGVPGGKERETIDCPTCQRTVGSEVTSAIIHTERLTDAEKINFLRSCHVSAGRPVYEPARVTDEDLYRAEEALVRWRQLDSTLGRLRMDDTQRRGLEAERAAVSATYKRIADQIMAEQFRRLADGVRPAHEL
ncbi:hypothetical protein [Pseudomonas oryzihabitans]|uniref:hypothetical protein n=1 Tax=Pseudomonas oryzihabitans TaxID=47885 RepID=UPI0028AAF8F3|nr:hypothetical protein [Pseudomonas oryzihabitans]